MIFHVSCRALPHNGSMISPKDYFKMSFVGLDFTANKLFENRDVDGRMLYEIELDAAYTPISSPSDVEVKTVILEALTMFGVHLKTIISAEALLEELSGYGWHADGGKLIKDV